MDLRFYHEPLHEHLYWEEDGNNKAITVKATC